MARVGYPSRKSGAMIEQHREFALRVRRAARDFREGCGDLGTVRALVRTFLAEHEFGENRPLARWMRRGLVTEGTRELRFFTASQDLGGRVEVARLEYSEGIPSIAVSRPELLSTDLVGKMLTSIAQRTGLTTAHISWTTAG